MLTTPQLPGINRLLAGLSISVRSKISQHCDSVQLEFGNVLCEPGESFKYVYFPMTGFISLVTTLKGHQPLEMGLIGNEGMLGATLALGINKVPMGAVVQGKGIALRMTAAQFQRELRRTPVLLHRTHRYLYVLITQLAQTAACTHFHEIEPRLARWLLMTHDRAQADHFHLTQEFLADMLGVRRSGVTVAAGALQERKLISYTRGEITILNRSGLETAACECYDAVRKGYKQVFV